MDRYRHMSLLEDDPRRRYQQGRRARVYFKDHTQLHVHALDADQQRVAEIILGMAGGLSEYILKRRIGPEPTSQPQFFAALPLQTNRSIAHTFSGMSQERNRRHRSAAAHAW